MKPTQRSAQNPTWVNLPALELERRSEMVWSAMNSDPPVDGSPTVKVMPPLIGCESAETTWKVAV